MERVASILGSLASDVRYLSSKGVTVEEFTQAFPAAIQKLRGSDSASNAERRSFLVSFFNEMQARGHITKFEMPRYGDDTIYKLAVSGIGAVAIIQKGCPDGEHSSVNWTRPDWAVEAYLWWVCPSMNYEPGVHVWKGVARLRQRFFSDAPDTIDGVIFQNELCGSPSRPCPKANSAIVIGGKSVPPPCLYVMPEHTEGASEWNWAGHREVRFPAALHAMFGISSVNSPMYTGHVGFQRQGASIRTAISCLFGPGRSTIHRS